MVTAEQLHEVPRHEMPRPYECNEIVLKRLEAVPAPTETEPTSLYTCKIASLADEEQTITGVVLEPGTIDAQGDRISEEVIRKAALGFGIRLNKGKELKAASKTGIMHTDFTQSDDVRVAFSWVNPVDLPAGTLGDEPVLKGSWMVTVKVFKSKLWKDVKKGIYNAFSIGGKTKARRTKEGLEVAARAKKNNRTYYQEATLAVRQAKNASTGDQSGDTSTS